MADNAKEIVVNEEVESVEIPEEVFAENNNVAEAGLIGALAAIATGGIIFAGKRIAEKVKPAIQNAKIKAQEKREARKSAKANANDNVSTDINDKNKK